TPIITNVTLNPDPPKANSQLEVKVSATTNEDIVDGYVFLLLIFNKTNKTILFGDEIDICTTVKCPTKVFNFDMTFTLGDLLSSYLIGVEIGDPHKIMFQLVDLLKSNSYYFVI
ncbi:35441_t:CDS:1, partial [Racocetra persica]